MKINKLWQWARQRRTLDKVREFANIGARSSFLGTLQGKDNYIVRGEVEGESDLNGFLILEKGSRWKGNINAVNVVVAGEVEGNVTALAKLDLAPTARIKGALNSPEIAIAEGAVYGKIEAQKNSRVIHYKERRGLERQDDKT
ncbi:MAG TPA: polymer-forming cytoskeletal protein [Acidiferrobacterales bacterium]|nr:polymer-forming cytoskeletal protein [Acidiferrobacterales bacterium]